MARYRGATCAPAIERIARRSHVTRSDCWEWGGYRDRKGYGRISDDSSTVRLVHRVAYEYLVAEIPDDPTIDHSCQNPACWNPQHLELVPRSLNSKRAALRNPPPFECPAGHQFTPENTGTTSRGWRYCRQCARDRARKRAAARLGMRFP